MNLSAILSRLKVLGATMVSAGSDDARKIAVLGDNGKLDTTLLPDAGSSIVVTVADQAERYDLTSADVQIDDIVFQTDDSTYWKVVNIDELDNADGWAQESGLIPLTQKGAADGVASLDGTAKIPADQLPDTIDARIVPVFGTTEEIDLYIGVEGELAVTPTSIRIMDGSTPGGYTVGGGGATSFTVISTAGDLTAGLKYAADTTSAGFTRNLPASPVAGDTVEIIDAKGTFATNNLTVGRNTQKIKGLSSDFVCDIDELHVTFVYVDVSYGWEVVEG